MSTPNTTADKKNPTEAAPRVLSTVTVTLGDMGETSPLSSVCIVFGDTGSYMNLKVGSRIEAPIRTTLFKEVGPGNYRDKDSE